LSAFVLVNGLTTVFPANVNVKDCVRPRKAFGSATRSAARHLPPANASTAANVRRLRLESFVDARTFPVQAFGAFARAGTANDTPIVVRTFAPDTATALSANDGVTGLGAFAAAGTAASANAMSTERLNARIGRRYQRAAARERAHDG
jgi:hypothetical protein